ncbi:MAG: UDP-galactopyranose mutase [Helicobacteraceae bacterium]|nr:UDP-galactopyranose mutase [Helicobacteraceae bacterium]
MNYKSQASIDISAYDLLIIGAGLSGSTIARLAAQGGYKTLMLEKRNHIAGNLYDEVDPNSGILVQRYGPHLFFTNDETVYKFITSIDKWNACIVHGRANIDGIMVPSPFNNILADTFFSTQKAREIKMRLAKLFPDQTRATILQLLESGDSLVKEYAEFMFEKDYKPYTIKHWGIAPNELDRSILERVPVRLDYTDRLSDKRHQLLPISGFTAFVACMLRQPNIDVALDADARNYMSLDDNKVKFCGKHINIPVVYTGALDRLLGYSFGQLSYRSVNFIYQTLDTDSFQETEFSIHPMAEGYTRITEYTKLPVQDGRGKTLIAYEYPAPYDDPASQIPYYPILCARSNNIYSQYRNIADQIPNLFLCGRLADFKYYNMDDAIKRAMAVFESIEQNLGGK